MRLPQLKIPTDDLRRLILMALKDGSNNFERICENIAKLSIQKKIVPVAPEVIREINSLDGVDVEAIRDIIWDLIIERILNPGLNDNNPDWPWFSLTDYGERVVNSTTPVLHDREGYLAYIQKETPNIDPVILTYLDESLHTYRLNIRLSSAITLGCASEKVMLLLIESYKNSLVNPTEKNRFIKDTDGQFILTQFRALRNWFSRKATRINREDPDITLLGIFEMIRHTRNDSGHPTGYVPSKELLSSQLHIFITYCSSIYKWIEYFNSNPQ
jgi:hypothetical protein